MMIWIFLKGMRLLVLKTYFCNYQVWKSENVLLQRWLLLCCCYFVVAEVFCWFFIFLEGEGLMAKAFPFSQQPMKYFLCRTPILWPLHVVVLSTILPTSSTFLTTTACLAVCYSNPYLTPWPTVHCSLIVPECRLCLLTTKTLPINTQVLRTSRKPPGRPFAQGGGA